MKRERYQSNPRKREQSNLVPRNAETWREIPGYSACKPGLNCHPSYNPLKMKYCDKCRIRGHHAFLCNKYEKWSENTCQKCRNGKHEQDICKNAPINPPMREEGFYSREYKNAKGKNVEKINLASAKVDESEHDLQTIVNMLQAKIDLKSEN